MADKKFQINYGKGVTVFPSKAVDKILGSEVSLSEIQTLGAILSSDGKSSAEEIAESLSLSAQDVENAIAFWRGTGIITPKASEKKLLAKDTDKATESNSVDIAGSESRTTFSSEKNNTSSDGVKSSSDSNENAPRVQKKAIVSAEMPKYSGEEISTLLEKDGGRLKTMVDECQQLIGHIFNPREMETLVGLCDWLGVDSDFVITLTAYCTRKKPGCNVRYIQKTALTLVNSEIDTISLLDEYLKHMEVYDGLAGKLRRWLGIGERTYTQKENATIKHWIQDLGYGEELVKYAFDITVERKLSFNFSYANAILENWFKDGVKTLADAEKCEEAFKNGKKAEKEKTDTEKSSFNTDEFFNLAVKRSYEKMASGKGKKDS